MGKFVIECPKCGRYVQANKGFFARRKIDCDCGYTIDVKTDKLTSRVCPHCSNNVVFDQSKGEKALCPVCHEPINTMAEQKKTVEFSCAQCGIRLRTTKGATTYTCPVCDCVNDVAERLKTEEIKHDGLASIIKYEGNNDTLVWKHPIEDFNMGSQLIVHESQEAIFFRDGQALDLFGPGRYTLETQQLPILEKLYQLPTDTEGTFHSEVYFINKVVQTAVKWGTSDKVRFIDPLTGVPLELGASGSLNLRVENSRKLLTKLVGTMKGISWGENGGFAQSLQATFRPMIVQTVKANLASAIIDNAIDLLEIDQHLPEISQRLHQAMLPEFREFGLEIPQFYVTAVVLPEEDPNFRRIRDLHTITLQTRMVQAEATVKSAQAQAQAQYRTAEEQAQAAIEVARREAELQKQQTETEIARREAERKVIAAQAEAQTQRMAGLTEAEIMQAKGYNQKDVLQAEVQKAYAEGLGNMGSNGGGSGLGEIAGLGVTLGAMGNVMNMTKEAMEPMFWQPEEPAASPATGWECPDCGQKNITSNFCPNCGSRKPAPKTGWACPECGEKNITSNFCPNCGHRKPEESKGWDCLSCGHKNIMSRFCPDCGCKKPEEDLGWTCPDCGEQHIKTNFCPNCGHKKGE